MVEDAIQLARKDEAFLLDVFEGFKSNYPYDSIADWIVQVLKRAPDLAAHFELPSSKNLIGAYEAVLKSNSLITAPLLRLLTARLNLYFSIVPEILSHAMASEHLIAAASSVQSFRELLRRYNSTKGASSYEPLASALKTHRIHFYQDEWNNTALRAVLTTFYQAPFVEKSTAKSALLKFMLSQLLEDTKATGHIPEPRHAWWALQILSQHADAEWLNAKKRNVEKIIDHLLVLPEYSPSQDVITRSLAPELQTREGESLWIGINVVRVLCSKLTTVLRSETITRLQDCLKERIAACNDLQGAHSFKIRTIRLLFNYELLRFDALESAQRYCRCKQLKVGDKRLGATFWIAPVLEQVEALTTVAEEYLKSPMTWIKQTSTAAMLCGLPGQGKSELLVQFPKRLAELCKAAGRELEVRSYSVGKEINSAAGLHRALKAQRESASKYPERAILLQFDEIDKAGGFDIYTPFLSTLEETFEPGKRAITFWVFAQSRFPQFAEFQRYAAQLEDKSLRDFLTRMLWGGLDLPELRFSPEQRLLTAIGYTMLRYGELSGFTGNWGAYFAGAYHLRNARALTKEVDLATEMDDQGFANLPPDRALAATWLVNLADDGRNRVRILS